MVYSLMLPLLAGATLKQKPRGTLYKRITCPATRFNKCFTPRPSAHRFQLVDHARDYRQAAVPEFGIPGVEPERLEQLGIMLGAAGREHRQIALGEAALR